MTKNVLSINENNNKAFLGVHKTLNNHEKTPWQTIMGQLTVLRKKISSSGLEEVLISFKNF